MKKERDFKISDIPDELVLTMVATIIFLWTSSQQQMEYFNFIIGITNLIKKGIATLTVILRL